MRISVSGPHFKDAGRYLTHEGYPLGTTCWYVRLEIDGLIRLCCADSREDAVEAARRVLQGELAIHAGDRPLDAKGGAIIPAYLLRRQLVHWLYPLTTWEGDYFPAGTLFAVLRQDGDRVNLCEVTARYPHIGRSVFKVAIR
jgi:hypothetical protein